MEIDMEKIEEKLGYTFSDKSLLQLAFIHRSYFNEHQDEVEGHNERLEFLGDAVLGLIVSRYLYKNLPSQSEGHLSHLRSHVVGADACVSYTQSLGLEAFLLFGKGESENLGRGRQRILADLLEAVIGAIFLDGTLEAARAFFLRHFSTYLDESMENPLRNWKADLQDYAQKKVHRPPDYVVVEESGPPHKRTFAIAVNIDGNEVGRGEGPSKKEAEQAAAEDALRLIEKEEFDG